MERTDENLRAWADEHLLYEVRMLSRAGELIAKNKADDALTNIEVESFAIHARCLREFLWRDPSPRYPDDARAVHFCGPGRWEQLRGPVPAGVDSVAVKTARDVVHPTYGRLGLSEAAKGWDIDLIVGGIGRTLATFADAALPGRLSTDAPTELLAVAPAHRVGSVATAMISR